RPRYVQRGRPGSCEPELARAASGIASRMATRRPSAGHQLVGRGARIRANLAPAGAGARGVKPLLSPARSSRRAASIVRMPTAVVTGGAGFLGSHLCDSLVADGFRVICVDNLETGSLQNVEHLRGDAFTFVNHDLT